MSVLAKSPRLWYRLVSWVLSTSVFAAACALSLTLATEKLLQGELLPAFSPLHLLVVGCTLAEYNVHYLWHRRRIASVQVMATMPYPGWWHPALFVAGIALCAVALPQLPRIMWLWIAALGIFALLYSAPTLPLRPKRNIHDFGITKLVVLTATWVAVTTILPALYLKMRWHAAGMELIWRSLLILPLCIAFDIRDIISDKNKQIETLAAALGKGFSYSLCYWILFLLFTANTAYYASVWPPAHQYGALIISDIAAVLAIKYSRSHHHPFVYAALIDGVMLLYGLVSLLA